MPNAYDSVRFDCVLDWAVAAAVGAAGQPCAAPLAAVAAVTLPVRDMLLMMHQLLAACLRSTA